MICLRALCASAVLFGSMATAQSLHEVPLTEVKLTDAFWAPRLETNRAITLWCNIDQCEKTGRIANFARAGKLEPGKHQGALFNDSDVYKVIEAASYTLATHPDEKLDAKMDQWIATIAAAQQPDGYLYTFHTLGDPSKRFTNLKDGHELYCAGHLIEAAVAHQQATKKTTLLAVAVRLADLIDATFGDGKRHDVDGHEEIELALFKLADATGQAKYKTLGEFFIRERGDSKHRKPYGPYYQDTVPVDQFDAVVGHAVRQMYLNCAMTDMALAGDASMAPALERMWTDMTTGKLYLTGGVGARHKGEAFGEPFELPNESAYAETCAGIGSALWNHRMNLLTGEARYADMVEQVTYNGFLSAVSLKGDRFFYVNPLASKGAHHRQSWYDCACCPPNVARFMATIPSRAYASDGKSIHVNLYAAGEARVICDGGEVRIRQETNYPWDGKVKITLNPEPAFEGAIKLRLPAWSASANITINGNSPGHPVQNGYAVLGGNWKSGDVIVLDLPMPVKRVRSDPRVKENVGRVALQRGPIVYCAEAIDNHGKAIDLKLPVDAKLTAVHKPDLLGGVTVITSDTGATFIPYCSWDNRDAGEMAVWVNE